MTDAANAPAPVETPAPAPASAPAAPAPTQYAPAAPAPAAPAPAPAPATAPVNQAPAPVNQAPAQYQVPAGVTLDSETLTEMAQAAHRAGMAQDQFAQQVASLNHALGVVQGRANQAAVARAEAALKADPDFGGANYDKTLSDAKATVEALGGQELLAEIDASGLGNSPALIKALAKLARSGVVKGSFVAGGNARDGERSLADLLYGG